MDNSKVKAQVSLEFVATFVMLVLFVVLVAKMFVWFGARIVSRHEAYELSRNANAPVPSSQVDFFTGRPGNVTMDVFNENQ